MTTSVGIPFVVFPDVDGDPLDDGYIYVGTAGLNAESNQVQAYWDVALTIPAAQPIRTINGYPSRSGTPARIYVSASDYSILVKNKNGTLVWSSLTSTEAIPSSSISGQLPASQVDYTPPQGPLISLSGFLDRQGIWAGSADEIQDALDYIESTSKRDVVQIAPGKSLSMSSGLSVNASYASIAGNGSELDFSALISGNAITVIGSVNPPYQQSLNLIERLRLNGPGKASSVKALSFDDITSAGDGPSHIGLFRNNIQNFGVGEYYGSRAYLIQAIGCVIYNCGIGVHGDVATDGGENMQRIGGAIFNSDLAVKLANANGAFHFYGTSIDYNGKIAELTNGALFLSDCHIEAGDYTDTPFTLTGNGAMIRVNGGWMLLTGSAPATMNHWVDAAANTSFRLKGTRMNNTRTASNEFATGAGDVSAEWWSYSTHENSLVLHSDRSKMVDGGFEAASIQDDIFITADTAAYTDRHNGTNIDLTVSATEARTGLQSLRYQKQFGAGSNSAFALACVAMNPGDIPGGRFYYNKPGASTGSFRIDFGFAKLRVDADGIPKFLKYQILGDSTETLTGSATGWVEKSFNSTIWQCPEWATHFVVRIDGFSWAATTESIYFDDVNINKVG